jgi:exodeoxyribonuclease V beta subunit
MSHPLNPLSFPLNGTRLIEASAGTGKTWTIAALYVRLVLGHGAAESAYLRPLQPAEILVMTFTRAATRELSDRIRERLVEAARYFRGGAPHENDPYLDALLDDYRAEPVRREQAAYRLMMAAEAMDEAAVFTIDAWCQRMLREHAFDSGNLFDEELVDSERELLRQAVRDYWRHHVYSLPAAQFDQLHDCWRDVAAFENAVRGLVERVGMIEDEVSGEALGVYISRVEQRVLDELAGCKREWAAHAGKLETWFARNRASINRNTYRSNTVEAFFTALHEWANSATLVRPGEGFYANNAWAKWGSDKLTGAIGRNRIEGGIPAEFEQVAALKSQLDAMPAASQAILVHAATAIARRIHALKADARKFGYADMLIRLKTALAGENGAALRSRIVATYPVALIDEFQDTSPDQYRIFDMLYDVAGHDAHVGLFLIGDPKQAIYGFRGADIHSYLAARRATEGRHYWLGRNFRSTTGVVAAVNQLFVHAEGKGARPGHPRGAFGFRDGADNALPFQEVDARDRDDRLVDGQEEIPAMTVLVGDAEGYDNARRMQQQFAQQCAERIVTLLNDPSVGFRSPQGFARLQPADIAVLVRDRYEAAAIQDALYRRGVLNVYLSDSDSVFASDEAADVLCWLQAIANPLDGTLVRCALATRTADVPLPELAALTVDDLAWEARVEQLKELRQVWQRHGVLAMLRRFLHELDLPERLLARQGGERSLTNLLHLAELLQRESQRLDGEQGLVRWLGEQINSSLETGEEHVLRLESDAQLVKIVTIHASKGLEYPLVFLPYAGACRPGTAKNRSYFEYLDAQAGRRRIDFTLSEDVRTIVDKARLEEEIRLLYVALTRARHAVWLGVADVDDSFRKSALGYLVNGGVPTASAELAAAIRRMAGGCEHIDVCEMPDGEIGTTILERVAEAPALSPRREYGGWCQRSWSVASYSSISKGLAQLRAPATPAEQKMLEQDAAAAPPAPAQAASWHRFARGALPGNFIHELLEWMLEEGFQNAGQHWYREQLVERCGRSAWKEKKEELADWLLQAVQVPLPPLGVSLSAIGHSRAETEFWIPTAQLQTAKLDQLCRAHLMPELDRTPLSERELSGMLHGFIDLVFEHDGRYWILDYKSNTLGNDDDAYHLAALQGAVVGKRYEVQGMIYLLALHRLLKERLGAGYEPARQLGGALFLFLRGVGNATTRGCCPLLPDLALLDTLDRLLPSPRLEVHA